MKKALTYKVFFGLIIGVLYGPLSAQQKNTPSAVRSDSHETNSRVENYLELKNMGYTDSEIFEDLGNVGFLSQNYGTALFWYHKLREIRKDDQLPSGFQKRYEYAKEMVENPVNAMVSEQDNWLAMIKSDYHPQLASPSNATSKTMEKYRPLHLEPYSEVSSQDGVHYGRTAKLDLYTLQNEKGMYEAPVALTADGNTAYYSKGVYEKPVYGLFSKKELVHKIFRAQKVNGEWKTISALNVSPKNFSALHPAISPDGSQLYFASNMPGTYGEFDIYVVDIHKNGTHSGPKNLGEKVNTRKNDLYPNIVGGGTLFFASEGRKGYGGLDVYMTEVKHNAVGLAVHLGSPINSTENDYSVFLRSENGMGYVMSNRGANKEAIRQVAFSYPGTKAIPSVESNTSYDVLEVLNKGSKIDYSNAVLEDQ